MGKRITRISLEHQRKFTAGGRRALRQRQFKQVALASGMDLRGVPTMNPSQQSAVSISPAAWKSVYDHIGDCEYVDDGIDAVLMRALRERVVYAQPLGHHEPVFQDVTCSLIGAVEKICRKNGQSKGLLPKLPPKAVKKSVAPKRMALPTELLMDRAKVVKVAKLTGHRKGKGLLDVVSDLFERKEEHADAAIQI